jgi:dolichyl-phosphate-mannose-protein mannosyltransferase
MLSEGTLFLHHYLPALVFKLLLMSALIEHMKCLIPLRILNIVILILISSIVYTFIKFLPLSFGLGQLNSNDILNLKWKDSWQLIIHK